MESNQRSLKGHAFLVDNQGEGGPMRQPLGPRRFEGEVPVQAPFNNDDYNQVSFLGSNFFENEGIVFWNLT